MEQLSVVWSAFNLLSIGSKGAARQNYGEDYLNETSLTGATFGISSYDIDISPLLDIRDMLSTRILNSFMIGTFTGMLEELKRHL